VNDDDITPASTEAAISRCVRDMYVAQKVLRDARHAESRAKIAFKRAEARAYHRDDCPQPKRGLVTVGDRDAWIFRQVIDEWEAWEVATTVREVAQDTLRVILADIESQRQLNASARTAYSVAGHA
jgi:hypothetical protein